METAPANPNPADEPISGTAVAESAGQARGPAPPWYLVAAALVCGLAVAVPLLYLALRAGQAYLADPQAVREMIFSMRNLVLLGNTLGLAGAVLFTTTLIALPAAWLTVRTDLPARRFFAVAMVMPLAVPGYLLAYTLLSVGGAYGAAVHLIGIELPRMSGFAGALIALSLYNFPYMFLNLRSALLSLDPSLEEVAQSLGRRRVETFLSIVLPHLRPALVAGGIIVILHVISDFGVVYMMGFPTFSYVLFEQYDQFRIAHASVIALMMVGLATSFIALELLVLRNLRLHRAGSGMARQPATRPLGPWKLPAISFLLLILSAAIVLPTATVIYWATRADLSAQMRYLSEAVADSLLAALPAALLATALAVPIAYLARRYRGKRSALLERFAYLGYATPALAFALGLIVLGQTLPAWMDPARRLAFQTMPLALIFAYTFHFLAEAVGPIRAGLFQATPRLEEASRSLGISQLRTFFRVTLPLLGPGLTVAMALVFLSAMKELPLTFLLAPLDYQTLATNVWWYTLEAQYAEAAPFALMILVISAGFVGVLMGSEKRS